MHESERVTLARLPSGVRIETTVHSYGTDDGPTLYVQAAQHGREVNGAEVLRRFHERVDTGALRGRVVAVPVANPLTFDRVSYTTPERLDSVNANMNRVWPGDESGTLHERMAATLWAYASEADAIVDLHTGGPDMLTHVVFKEGDAGARALAEAFGTGLLLGEPADDDERTEWSERDFDGKFRVAASEAGIPAITPELAHNKQLVEPAIETGVEGLFDVCRSLGMLDGRPTATDQTLARNHLGSVEAADSGLFRPHPNRAVGQTVEAGDPLGTLYDPANYAVLQEATVGDDGVLYALTREATVTAGQSLGNVALVREEGGSERTN
ncbi:succinylglutamate desuccinylase/aspartoacylase family protein [Halomarina oriensis]|uniref:Succinylglutamate desuccinylase n=1 Tax=Halomarina oriensis TaxID=671145 RepID=A0A6B0GJM8_9EURY|nr:succinylglutamate desuccinylase/aspartoacylase family protein [Halomarina oriensis]MWG34061.1 succinylglutamate desuccinylase [Halomarina oriensis]